MSFRTFLWIEDRKDKAAYIFWNNFMRRLYPDVVVESKKNNSELVKAVKSLEDINNRYITQTSHFNKCLCILKIQ